MSCVVQGIRLSRNVTVAQPRTAARCARGSTPAVLAAEHVTLTSTKGPMGPLMAEHVVLLMLALARDLPGFLQQSSILRKRNNRRDVDIQDRSGSEFGIADSTMEGIHSCQCTTTGARLLDLLLSAFIAIKNANHC